MKKLLYVLIALMLISVIPEVANAQSNDPFEQKTLKATGKSGKHEKKVSRKKVEAPVETATVVDDEKPQAKKQTVTLSNGSFDCADATSGITEINIKAIKKQINFFIFNNLDD